MTFDCKFLDKTNTDFTKNTKFCLGNETLETIENAYTDVSNLRTSYNIYTSVQVAAKSLHDLRMCQNGKGPFSNGTCARLQNIKPWQVTEVNCYSVMTNTMVVQKYVVEYLCRNC